MLRSDPAVVDAVAEWLYLRIMEERKVWYEEQGYSHIPTFGELNDIDRDLWRGEADELLAVVGQALR